MIYSTHSWEKVHEQSRAFLSLCRLMASCLDLLSVNCLHKGSGAFFLYFFTVSDRSSSDVVNKALFTALTYSIKNTQMETYYKA